MIKPAFIMAAVIALAACSAFTTTATFHPYVDATFPPTERVEVFTSKAPEKDYVEIGIIEVQEGDLGPGMMKQAIARAKAVGADGLILLETGEYTVYVVAGTTIIPAPYGKMKFTAIRYK